MTSEFSIPSDVVVCAVQSLVHVLWQGLLIFLVAWFFERGSGSRTARASYFVWFAALCLMVCCLPVNAYLLWPEGLERRSMAETAPAASVQSIVAGDSSGAFQESATSAAGYDPAPSGIPAGAVVEVSNAVVVSGESRFSGADSEQFRPRDRISLYVIVAYCVGLLGMILRLSLALGGAHRLRRCSQLIADSALVATCDQCARKVGLRLFPIVAECRRVTQPLVVGIVKPIVLLPTSLISQLTPAQLETILLHEFAHIRRCDPLMNLIQRLAETVLFFHPAIWLISRRVSSERENCCDDLVLQLGIEPVHYAESLLRVSEIRNAASSAPSPSAAVLAAADADESVLRRRITRILDSSLGEIGVRASGTAVLLLTAFVALLGIVLVSLWIPTFVAADESETAIVESSSVAEVDSPEEVAPSSESEQDTRFARYVSQLNHDDWLVREQSLRAIAAMKRPDTVDLFVTALRDEHASVRKAAIYSFREMPSGKTVDKLVSLLKQEQDPDRARNIAAALSWAKDARVLEPLLHARQQFGERSGSSFPRTLRSWDVPGVNDALLRYMYDASGKLDRDVVAALVYRKEVRAADAIHKELESNAGADRNLLLSQLADLGDRRCVATLLVLLKDKDLRARASAIGSLGKVHGADFVSEIVEAASELPDDWDGRNVRQMAARVLVRDGDRSALETVARWASDTDVSGRTRESYVECFESTSNPIAVELLVEQAKTETDVRVLAAISEVLGKIGDTSTVETLTRLSQHENRYVQRAAKPALASVQVGAAYAKLHGDDERAFELAAGRLGDSDESIAVAAIQSVASFDDPRVIELLSQHSDDPRRAVRYAIYSASSYRKDSSVDELLLKLTSDSDEKIRLWYARSLASKGDARAVDALLKLSESDNEYSRREAAEALGDFGQPRVIARLTEMIFDEDRHAATDAMKALAKTNTEVPLDAVLKCLSLTTSKKQLEPLVAIIGHSNDARATGKVEELLGHEEYSVRYSAARSLAMKAWTPQNRTDRLRYLAASGRQDEVEKEVPAAKESGKHRVRGEFHRDVPITARVRAGTPEWPSVVWTQSIEFTVTDAAPKATVRAGNYSYPGSEWRIQVELFDAENRKIASAFAVKKVSGYRGYVIATTALHPLSMTFDSADIDVELVKTFELSAELIPLPVQAGQPVIEISPPVETDFAMDKLIAENVTATTLLGEDILSVSGVTISTGEPVSGSPTLNAKFTVQDHSALSARWRLWMFVADDSGSVMGRGEQVFETERVIAGTAVQEKKLTIPVVLRSDWVPGGRIRFCVAMVPPTEEQTAADLAKTAEHVVPLQAETLSRTDETAEGKRSLAASGHALRLTCTGKERFVEAIQLFGSRYGNATAPRDDFHVYLLNQKYQVLSHLKFPYALIPRGEMKWHTLRTPSIEVPETFYVAVAFNPHATKGVYLGFDDSNTESHSFTGLVGDGFQEWKSLSNWMIRAHVSEKPTGERGVRKLADWTPPVASKNPFASSVEYKTDAGKSDGQQSYGGAGPVLKIPLTTLVKKGDLPNTKLTGLRIYGSRYGSGFDPDQTMFHVDVLNDKAAAVWQHHEPYSTFGYKPKWVDVVFEKPVAVSEWLSADDVLTIGIDPESHQRKGVYFHYSKTPPDDESTTSHGFVPGKRFFDVKERQWMTRAYFSVDAE